MHRQTTDSRHTINNNNNNNNNGYVLYFVRQIYCTVSISFDSIQPPCDVRQLNAVAIIIVRRNPTHASRNYRTTNRFHTIPIVSLYTHTIYGRMPIYIHIFVSFQFDYGIFINEFCWWLAFVCISDKGFVYGNAGYVHSANYYLLLASHDDQSLLGYHRQLHYITCSMY